jgi:hypothetical protein
MIPDDAWKGALVGKTSGPFAPLKVTYKATVFSIPTTEYKAGEFEIKADAMTAQGYLIDKVIPMGYPSSTMVIIWRKDEYIT